MLHSQLFKKKFYPLCVVLQIALHQSPTCPTSINRTMERKGGWSAWCRKGPLLKVWTDEALAAYDWPTLSEICFVCTNAVFMTEKVVINIQSGLGIKSKPESCTNLFDELLTCTWFMWSKLILCAHLQISGQTLVNQERHCLPERLQHSSLCSIGSTFVWIVV